MNIAHQNKVDSFKKSKPDFNRQETLVMDCIKIGLTNPESISDYTGELLTSIRRAVTNLKDRKEIIESGKVLNKKGDRSITTYKINIYQLTLI